MQNYLSNFFLFFLIFALLFSQPVYAQKLNASLNSADSLFQNKEYLAAQAIYRQILNSGKQYSPQMLLKMAYTEEALHHFSESMYYLNLYYNLHPNRNVLRKMEEVAQTNGLIGYEYRDIDFFLTQFKKYYLKLLEFMLIIAVATVTIMVLKREQQFFKSTGFRVAFLIYLAFIAYFINFFTFRNQGITTTPQAALMASPSAGSKWVGTLGKGNRLTISGERDIWYEVTWQDQKAYIRKQNLRVLPE